MASKFYEIEDGQLKHTHRTCPKCGPGYYLANHYDRFSCGKCGYTVFKRKGKKSGAISPPKGVRRAPRQRKKAV
jgi:small subunit ribosomal protein S27Ae